MKKEKKHNDNATLVDVQLERAFLSALVSDSYATKIVRELQGEIVDDDFTDGKIGLLDLLVIAGLAPSKGEGRRLVQQGGVSVDGEKVADIKTYFAKEELTDGKLLRKGKKTYMKVIAK